MSIQFGSTFYTKTPLTRDQALELKDAGKNIGVERKIPPHVCCPDEHDTFVRNYLTKAGIEIKSEEALNESILLREIMTRLVDGNQVLRLTPTSGKYKAIVLCKPINERRHPQYSPSYDLLLYGKDNTRTEITLNHQAQVVKTTVWHVDPTSGMLLPAQRLTESQAQQVADKALKTLQNTHDISQFSTRASTPEEMAIENARDRQNEPFSFR